MKRRRKVHSKRKVVDEKGNVTWDIFSEYETIMDGFTNMTERRDIADDLKSIPEEFIPLEHEKILPDADLISQVSRQERPPSVLSRNSRFSRQRSLCSVSRFSKRSKLLSCSGERVKSPLGLSKQA